MSKSRPKNIVKGAIAGLVGGLAASFVMTQFQALVTAVSESESNKSGASKKEEEEPANVKVAEDISETVLDHNLTKKEKESAGEAVHYAMGAVSGIILGISAELAPVSGTGVGLPFGTSVWILADNLVVPALGYAKSPTTYSLSTHAYGLASHLVYGLTTELVRRRTRDLLD